MKKLGLLLLGTALVFGFAGCNNSADDGFAVAGTPADNTTKTPADAPAENTPKTPAQTKSFTVTFNTNGGSSVEKQTVKEGEKASKPADPTKANDEDYKYAFAGWFKDSALTSAFDFENAITADITLYAKWAAIIYIGTKKPSVAKAVGDIVFNDGSATPYSSELSLTDAQKAAAVAVIFYAGSSDGVLGAKTLGVGLHNTYGENTQNYIWARENTTGYSKNFTDIQCMPNGGSLGNSGAAATATFTGDLDGSDNWTKICETDTTAQENAATNYPAFNWVNNYGSAHLLKGDCATGWYLPTIAELTMMYRELTAINAALELAGGTKIAYSLGDNNFSYWSSSQFTNSNMALYLVIKVAKIDVYYKNSDRFVCAIRAF